MALQTIRNVGVDLVTRTVGALFEAAKDTMGATLEYTRYGFQDKFPDSPDETMNAWWAPAPAALTVEGETYFSNQRYRGYPDSFTLYKYTSRLSYSEEVLAWLAKAPQAKQTMEVKSMTTGAVQSLNYRIDELANKFFYLGFGTTFVTGGDASAIFATGHANRYGSTLGDDNIFPSGETHRAFSETALVDALIQMNRYVGQNGVQMLPVKRAVILCSHEKLPVVQKIVESKYGINSPNLGVNVANKEAIARRGISIDYQVMSILPVAYKNYWWIVDLDRAQDRLFMCWLWKPRTANDATVSNGTWEMDASFMGGPASCGWQWGFGSKGDESTIA